MSLSAPSSTATRPSGVRHFVLVWLCAAATVAYIARNALGVAEESIRKELGLTDLNLLGTTFTPKEQMGWVMSAFFLSYALLQVPTGWLGQVLGARRALPLFAGLWSAATGAMALAAGLPALVLTRFISGGAQAGLFPSTTDAMSRWFSPGERAFATGAITSFMSVGGAFGAYLTGVLLDPEGGLGLGWRIVFGLYALPGVLWGIGFWFWFRDRPRDHAGVNRAELDLIAGGTASDDPPTPAGPIPWGALLGSPALWWINGQQFFRAAGYIFFASWFPTYLKETRGVTTEGAGLLTSLPLLATVVGCLVGGSLSDALWRRTRSRRVARQGLAVVSLFVCAGLTFAAYFIAEAWLAVLCISAGTLFAAAANPCAYAVTIDIGGRHVTTVFSIMNMTGNIGAVVFPIFVPWLVALTGSWDLVLFVFAGIFLAAALCWLGFNPDRPILPTPQNHDRGKF